MLLDYVSSDPDDERLETLFAVDADTYGKPSLFARALGHNSAVLAARQAYVGELTEADALDERQSELLYAAVATSVDCEYCTASHAHRLVEHLDLDPTIVETLATGEDVEEQLDETDALLVRVGRQIADDPKRVSQAHIDHLRVAGFDDAGIVELVVVASAAVAATTIADTLNILPQDSDLLEDYDGFLPGS